MTGRMMIAAGLAACLALWAVDGRAGVPKGTEGPQGSAVERKYDLKYALKKGQQFTLQNLYVGNTYLKRGDSKSKVSALTRDLRLLYKVVEADAAGVTFEVEYRSKVYRSTGNDGKVVVTDFAPIVGKKVRYTISPSGDLGRFAGFEEMPAVPMPGGWNYDGPRYREELEHMFLTLPTRPVGKGETWTRSAFGVKFEYMLLDEVKHFGRDCLRIFATIEDEQTRSMAKDRNGNDVQVERTEPYSDVYYFDYKNGMMLSRFSVASFGQQIVTDLKGAVLQHQVTDRLYETFVTFK